MNKSGDAKAPNRQKCPMFLETMVLYYKENISDWCLSPPLSLHYFAYKGFFEQL